MEILVLTLLTAVAAAVLSGICLLLPLLRRFALAVFTAPVITSFVVVFGSWILADMNPAREYGAAYIPTGREHDPTTLDRALFLIVIGATFTITAVASYILQSVAVFSVKTFLEARSRFASRDCSHR